MVKQATKHTPTFLLFADQVRTFLFSRRKWPDSLRMNLRHKSKVIYVIIFELMHDFGSDLTNSLFFFWLISKISYVGKI